mmetsp:Transcript_24092/g.77681  ORF Transcript_24092/g.77681 Transcript_24092/m.77681 type:complete len:262 (+) Transcript_24092:2318-3103(+)
MGVSHDGRGVRSGRVLRARRVLGAHALRSLGVVAVDHATGRERRRVLVFRSAPRRRTDQHSDQSSSPNGRHDVRDVLDRAGAPVVRCSRRCLPVLAVLPERRRARRSGHRDFRGLSSELGSLGRGHPGSRLRGGVGGLAAGDGPGRAQGRWLVSRSLGCDPRHRRTPLPCREGSPRLRHRRVQAALLGWRRRFRRSPRPRHRRALPSTSQVLRSLAQGPRRCPPPLRRRPLVALRLLPLPRRRHARHGPRALAGPPSGDER